MSFAHAPVATLGTPPPQPNCLPRFVEWESNADDDAQIRQLQTIGRQLQKELAELQSCARSRSNSLGLQRT